MSQPRHVSFVLTVILLCANGCGPDSEQVNPSDARLDYPQLNGEAVGPNIQWGELEFFDVSSDGRIVALDRYRSTITVFGEETSEFGTEGNGPGEIRLGGPIALIGDTVIMADKGRVTSWLTDGTYLASTAGVVGTQIHSYPSGGVMLVTPLSGLAADGVVISVFAAGSVNSITVPDTLASGDAVCGACQAIPLGEGRYVAGPAGPDDGPKLVDGRRIETWSYPVNRVYWTSEEWVDHLNAVRLKGSYSTSDPRMLAFFNRRTAVTVDPPEAPKRLVREWGLGVSGDLVVLLAQVPRGAPSAIDFFSTEGAYLGRLVLDRERVASISVEGEWLAAVAYDELDRPGIWRYSLTGVDTLLAD